MNSNIKDLTISIVLVALTSFLATCVIYVAFMPYQLFSAPVSASTRWGDAQPTNSIADIMSEAGFATTGYVNKVAYEALASLTNDNYSLIIDTIPTGMPWLAFIVDPLIATNANHKIYAIPRMSDISEAVGKTSSDTYSFGWLLVSNDVPCAITVRQPDKTTFLFRRDRLNSNRTYVQIEDGGAVLYEEH